MNTRPPPAPPTAPAATPPTMAALGAAIHNSADKLFFIAHSVDSTSRREWRLVRVNYSTSISLHPACLQDGRFLVDFYIAHTADSRYNAPNQRFWLQYHTLAHLSSPLDSGALHLIRPSETSEQTALRRGYAPFRQWVNLTHEATYIHGPFDFADFRGRRSRDRVSRRDFEVLIERRTLYDNDPPRLDLPTYSIHVDRGTHVTYHSTTLLSQVKAASLAAIANGDTLHP